MTRASWDSGEGKLLLPVCGPAGPEVVVAERLAEAPLTWDHLLPTLALR